MNHETALNTELKALVASLYFLRTRLQAFHWNVEGPYFQTLHALFEQQYDAVALQIDEFAERLRARGEYAPQSIQGMAKISRVNDLEETHLPWRKMLEFLTEDYNQVIALSKRIGESATDAKDSVTAGMVDGLAQEHQKAAWMIRSTLQG